MSVEVGEQAFGTGRKGSIGIQGHEGKIFPEILPQCKKLYVVLVIWTWTIHLILVNLSLLFKVRITTPVSLGSLGFMRIRFDCVCELVLETLKGSSVVISKPHLVPGT